MGDLDVWVEATPENAPRIAAAPWTNSEHHSPTSPRTDFATPGIVYQIGVPPGRIDILTDLTGITFSEAWLDRVHRPLARSKSTPSDGPRSCGTNAPPDAPKTSATSKGWSSGESLVVG